ncbi:amidohydrolase family protein [Viridothelium virens]|uniref:6-methylsalicylate decarboxylase n=1 Tax=Viridothelium virens TaxID=1048519 RepID=A0A6A6GWT2_VIRVR|nr:amidohydrolase family protein [Viridothelium virens]
MSKIDVHHHFYPQAMVAAIERAGGDPSGWYIPPWTLELDAEIGSLIGLKTTILSVTAPGPVIEKDSARAAALARECNEHAAGIRDQKPSEYGFFASLPSLFDTKLVLEELAYAFDVLKADGVTLYTRYGSGHAYLGHEAFKPIWTALNDRHAVVFIHPTHPVDTQLTNPWLVQPLFDYPHETGRTAMDIITGGVIRDFPQCKIILSHAGGTLPYLVYRAATLLPLMPQPVGLSREQVIEQAREFYFDTAISANPITLKALFEFAKPGHVLFGSDFPNAPNDAITYFTQQLDTYPLSEGGHREVESEAALELFPRLKHG